MTQFDKRSLLLATAIVATAYAQRRGGYGEGGYDDDDAAEAREDAQENMMETQMFRNRMLLAHGVMMSLAFAFMMPFGSTLIRLFKFRGTAWIHGGWQIAAYLVALGGFGIGVWFAYVEGYLTEAHPIIGIVVIAMLFLQPLGGFIAHLWFKRKQRRNFFGAVHRWNGRIFVTLGGINGGLGIQLTGSSRTWVIAYSVVAAFFFALWYGVSFLDWIRNRRKSGKMVRSAADEKALANEQRASESN
ncbi:hypothetical protein CAC42_8148 [Sphaceloma murrayae]|uniref:Cytochrome b561 domain-containing protein n=1 Tax=Sphaceloma murrayae TaxID=2082308 RepID=A0A2K1QJ35_9PEZI|nr:hypothetical protein CAC42_8148 [Sphaceloma murrayae]